MRTLQPQVLAYLLTIPNGKVVTYGQIAAALGNPKLARVVGNLLHSNPDGQKYPCYKVVSATGRLSAHFAFGGIEGQKARLRAEGIEVVNNTVDLQKYGLHTEM